MDTSISNTGRYVNESTMYECLQLIIIIIIIIIILLHI